MNSIIYFIKRNILIGLSALGLVSAIIFTNVYGGDKVIGSNSLASPPSSPYENTISGLGFIEASSRNINIGSFAPGIVSKVMVKEGDEISKGQPLFEQDNRSAKNIVEAREDELAIAKNNLEFSKIDLEDLKVKLKRAMGLRSGHTITEDELTSRKFAVEKAKVDVTVKKGLVSQAETSLEFAKIELDKTIIRSPIDGLVLKVRIRPGEFISGNEQDSNSPMLIGSTNPLYIRVQIDENDLWRFDESKPAYAYLRSNKDIKAPLSFIRLEPFADSKEKLRGSGSELIDTRIVDVIYKVDKEIEHLYIGQQLDVFIEATKGL